MSDSFRARRRRLNPGPLRRWATAVLAVGAAIALSVQTEAASAATAPSASPSAAVPASAAQPAHGAGAPQQGSPAYYDSGLDPTPYLGWNTYYTLGGAVTQSSVQSVANFLLGSGLAKAGYDYVWLDGGWQAATPRNASGELVANPTEFPDGIPALVKWLHARGLKAVFAKAGLSGNVSVRDLTARRNLGTFTGSYTTTVPADGTAMLHLTEL